MFIPRGDTLHENLATSYVLVDALITDLCEGGFSGIVEVVLRDTDSFITIAGGEVTAVLEKHGDSERNGESVAYARTTVQQLAERARKERGRISVYSYPVHTAVAVAGRINAQPLYVGLSTEFTDLEKMIWKLLREHDREWFIEINNNLGASALLHMHDEQCGVVSSRGDSDSGPLDLGENAALRTVLDECTRFGGSFDVYFTRPTEKVGALTERAAAALNDVPSAAETSDDKAFNDQPNTPDEPTANDEDHVLASSEEIDSSQEPFLDTPDFEATSLSPEPDGNSNEDVSIFPSQPSELEIRLEATSEGSAEELVEDTTELEVADLSLMRDEVPPVAAEAEMMTEIKRLLGEIARVIEEAAQAVDRHDSFSLALRAAQLKIADRFPFLDPFAGEFEYLAGEIVFVGLATAEEFVTGLSEALKLACEAVTQSTAYPDRFRAYLSEDLQKLLARERAALEAFALDGVVAEIANFQHVH